MLPDLEAARIDKGIAGNKLRSNMGKLTTQREMNAWSRFMSYPNGKVYTPNSQRNILHHGNYLTE
jgi:hypothetical protein